MDFFVITFRRLGFGGFFMRLTAVLILLLLTLGPACTKSTTTAEISRPNQSPSPVATSTGGVEEELEQRLKSICDRAQGTVAVSLVHIESGKSISINGSSKLTLYSVFKLPVAIAVLKDVEEGRLKLDQKVHVTPSELVPGVPANDALWRKPVDRTVAELIEVSIARSDNTSTDKLLQLVGGPPAVTERLRSLGFQTFDIHSTTAQYIKSRGTPNTGSADDVAQLLVQLHQGKIL